MTGFYISINKKNTCATPSAVTNEPRLSNNETISTMRHALR
jgi:hypothetical protein